MRIRKQPCRIMSRVKQPFYVKVLAPDGTIQIQKHKVPVRRGTKLINLVLTEEPVKKSIQLGGVGNTATCSMALCVVEHKDSFPHSVFSWVQWTYTRIFIVSRFNKAGIPIECVAYEHDDEIARLNDSKGGQQKLLARILKNGPITIKLKPYRTRSEEGRPGRNRKSTGVRTNLRGAKLRFAVASQHGSI